MCGSKNTTITSNALAFAIGSIVERINENNGSEGAKIGQRATVVGGDEGYVYVKYDGNASEANGAEVWIAYNTKLVENVDDAPATPKPKTRTHFRDVHGNTLNKGDVVVVVRPQESFGAYGVGDTARITHITSYGVLDVEWRNVSGDAKVTSLFPEEVLLVEPEF